MRLSYRRLEELVADLHDVSDRNRVALQGRIKNFQRYGWPGGTNTGKGKAAEYDFIAVFKLCLGFELLQIGVTPERAAQLLKMNWFSIKTALNLAVTAHPVLSGPPKEEVSEGFDVFIYCDPKALSYLSDLPSDPTDDTFFYTSSLEFGRRLLENRTLDVQRLALINITVILDYVAQYVEDLDDFRAAYREWSDGDYAADVEAGNAMANPQQAA